MPSFLITWPNMSGMRSSREKAKAAARQCRGRSAMMPKVVRTNSAAGAGTWATRSADGTSWPSPISSTKVSIRAVAAPASSMPARYSSKWLVKPLFSSSLSSTSTMSLMSLRLTSEPRGTQGTSTQVRSRWSDFSRDMKSQTANTWCAMNVAMSSRVLIRW